MNEPDPDEASTIERLSRRADQLATQVDELTEEVKTLNRRQGRTERMSIRTATGLAFLTALALLVGMLAWQQLTTREQVQTLVDREVQTRDQALCPLTGLLLGSYDPSTRPPGPARDKYEEAFRVMRDAYAALGCLTPLVPRRLPNT
jgi:hypothetical protein